MCNLLHIFCSSFWGGNLWTPKNLTTASLPVILRKSKGRLKNLHEFRLCPPKNKSFFFDTFLLFMSMKKKKSITKEENSLLAPPLWQGLCPRTPFKKQCHSEGVRSTTEESLGAKIISSFWGDKWILIRRTLILKFIWFKSSGAAEESHRILVYIPRDSSG